MFKDIKLSSHVITFGDTDKYLLEWSRTLYFDHYTGIVYYPAGALGDEDKMLREIEIDGAGILILDGHVYAQSSWFEENFPECADRIRFLANAIRKIHNGTEVPCGITLHFPSFPHAFISSIHQCPE